MIAGALATPANSTALVQEEAALELSELAAAASNGFADERANGTLDRATLERAIAEFGPRMSQDLRAARVVWEAAGELDETDARQNAREALRHHTQLALDEAGALREEGALTAARDVLETAQEAIPSDCPHRAFLFKPLADQARLTEHWEEALGQARAGLENFPADAQYALYRTGLLRTLATVRVHMGLPDMATEPLAAIQVELDRFGEFIDQPEHLAILRTKAEQWLATDRMETVVRKIEGELESLGDPAELHPWSVEERLKLLIQLGVARLELGAVDPERLAGARTALTEAWSGSAGPHDRLHCATRLGWAALLTDEPAVAATWISQARSVADTIDTTAYQEGYLVALEARLALAQGQDEPVLRRRADELTDELERMIERWNAARPRPGGLGFLRYSDRRFVVATRIELALRLDPQNGPLEALRILGRVRQCGSLVRRLEGAAHDLESTLATLFGAGDGALIYFTGRDRSHVFALEPGRPVLHEELAGEWPLRVAIRELSTWSVPGETSADERVRGLRRERFDRARAGLADLLLPAEVRARVAGWRTLTIVGSDLLLDVPFEHLPFGDTTLGLAKPVAYLTSLAEGATLAARAAQTERSSAPVHERIAMVADVPSATRPELPALVLADDRRSITERFDGRAELLLGKGATAEGIAEIFERVDLAAFLTHGLRAAALERPSQILVAPNDAGDDALGCSDLEHLAAPACVFLGVCGSGRGPEREGAGPVAHLGGAFLYAGASSVVLSDSDLSLGPTLEMLDAFVAALAEGAAPAEALRQARLAAFERGWTDPRHYPLRVIGLGHEPVFTPRPR